MNRAQMTETEEVEKEERELGKDNEEKGCRGVSMYCWQMTCGLHKC